MDSTTLQFTRTADHLHTYANNLRFERSVWDLCLKFGRLNQATQPHTVEQHVTIDIPWQQVKLLIYYLSINLLLHEAENGHVSIPASVTPNIGAAIANTPEAVLALPDVRRGFDRLHRLHEDLFGPTKSDAIPHDESA
jgi:hypothetical protein